MDSIFHEKQEGSLCAQHCLNALLQGPYFSPVDLAEIAQTLDESEREHMAEGGHTTQEYQQFIKQPSSNYDDSGFFSIQVLQKALIVWNLELIPFNSSLPVCMRAKEDPRTGQAYVCNFREHWLTIRRIGNQWFNLNSLLTGPELLSDTYLSLFLTQLQHEGYNLNTYRVTLFHTSCAAVYTIIRSVIFIIFSEGKSAIFNGYSIFVVVGELPPCEAHDLLMLIPAVQPLKPRLLNESSSKGQVSSDQRSRMDSDDDLELQRALAESRRLDEEQDESLKKALELSMIGLDASGYFIDTGAPSSSHSSSAAAASNPPPAQAAEQPDLDEMRRRRLARLDKPAESASGGSGESSNVKSSDNPGDKKDENKPDSKK